MLTSRAATGSWCALLTGALDIHKYKVGWLIVAFDLPVGTKPQRKAAHDFRE